MSDLRVAFLLLLSFFLVKRLKRMQKSVFLQANRWILKRNEYFCIYKYKRSIIYNHIIRLTYIVV